MAAPLASAADPDDATAARAWARSGAMALCGPAAGAPRAGAAGVALRAEAWARELCVRSGRGVHTLDGAALLGERAACLGLARRGRISPGGACRLLRTADAHLAVNLPRPDDRALLPAWLERDVGGDPWRALADALPERGAHAWTERALLLGLAVAVAAPPEPAPGPGVRVDAIGAERHRAVSGLTIVDLSSLWAGPLCTQLLGLAGARVVKVESTARPDGARRGPRAFFDLLNAGKASVALDLASTGGRDALRRLVDRADVVVEASRPRALRQLGVEAEAWLAAAPGRVWISITGHGRRGAAGERVAFGDDAAVAAGLAVASGSRTAPVFCADAVADPLAGLRAALETLRALAAGGGRLVDVSLAGVARDALGASPERTPPVRVVREDGAWWVEDAGGREPVAAPRARRARGRARPFGADTKDKEAWT